MVNRELQLNSEQKQTLYQLHDTALIYMAVISRGNLLS